MGGIVLRTTPPSADADTSPYTGEVSGEVRPPCGELPVKLRFQKAPLCKGGWLRACGDGGIVCNNPSEFCFAKPTTPGSAAQPPHWGGLGLKAPLWGGQNLEVPLVQRGMSTKLTGGLFSLYNPSGGKAATSPCTGEAKMIERPLVGSCKATPGGIPRQRVGDCSPLQPLRVLLRKTHLPFTRKGRLL